MRKLILIILLLFIPSCSWGTDYFVTTTGLDTNPCSSAQPCRSVNKGISVATIAGDRVIISAGTYTEPELTPAGQGAAGAYITYQANGADVVIIKPNGPHAAVNTGGYQYIKFLNLVFDGTGAGAGLFGIFLRDDNHLWFEGVEVKNWSASGISVNTPTAGNPFQTFHTFKNMDVHNNGTNCLHHGIYFLTGSNTIDGGRWHDNAGFGIQIYDGGVSGRIIGNNVIKNTEFFGNGDGTGCSGGLVVTWGDNNTISNISSHNNLGIGIAIGQNKGSVISHSIVYGNSLDGVRVFEFEAAPNNNDNIKVYNNTIYNNTLNGLTFDGAGGTPSTNCKATNNIIFSNGTDTSVAAGQGHVLTTNLVGIDPLFVNAAGADFNLQSGSPAIDAGTIITDYAYNGSVPDQGAFEAPVFGSGLVDSPATLVKATLADNPFAPTLPASGCTGFTVKANGVVKTLSSCVRTGDNRMDLTLASAIAGGDSVTIEYVNTGNITDSALIGGLKNGTMRTFGAQTVTNNVSGSSFSFTQSHGRFRDERGSETAAPWKTLTSDVSYTIMSPGRVRLRNKMTCTVGTCPGTGVELRYSKNGGVYTRMPDAYGTDGIRMCGASPNIGVNNETATTRQLTQDFATYVAGQVNLTQAVVPFLSLSLNSETEMEYCLEITSGIGLNTTWDFRLYQEGGTALATYTFTPRLTVSTPSLRRQ